MELFPDYSFNQNLFWYLASQVSFAEVFLLQVSKCLSALGCCVFLNLFAEITFDLRHCLCRVSCVGRHVVELLSGHPRPSRVRVSCLDPRDCHRVQDDPVIKSQPLCVCAGCSRGVLRSVRSCSTCVEDVSHVQLRILTLLLDWKRCSSSPSSSFSSICIVRPNNSAGFGCSVQFVILFDTFFISFEISSIFLACYRQCRNPPCLRKCKSVSFSED